MPESATLCGEPVALSVMVKAAVAAPVAVGLKAILTVQEAPGASGPVQLLHLENDDALGPVSAPLKFSVPVPVLLSVTCCAALVVLTFWLPKVRLV